MEHLNIPKDHLRKFLHLVHPDKFHGFDEEIRTTNQRSLSHLNSILDIGRKTYKQVQAERKKDKSFDFTISQDAPRPGTLEFWCHNDEGSSEALKHVTSTFDVP